MNTRKTISGRNSSGFLLLEILLAMAFLAIATGAALQLHRSRLDYDRQAMNRLRYQLAAENVCQRLAATPYDDIPELADATASQQGVRVETTPFRSESRSGVHVEIRAEFASGVVSRHFWRLEPSE